MERSCPIRTPFPCLNSLPFLRSVSTVTSELGPRLPTSLNYGVISRLGPILCLTRLTAQSLPVYGQLRRKTLCNLLRINECASIAFFIPMGGPQAHAKLGSCTW